MSHAHEPLGGWLTPLKFRAQPRQPLPMRDFLLGSDKLTADLNDAVAATSTRSRMRSARGASCSSTRGSSASGVVEQTVFRWPSFERRYDWAKDARNPLPSASSSAMISRTSALIVPPMKFLPKCVDPIGCPVDFFRDGMVEAGVARCEQKARLWLRVDVAQCLKRV